MAVQLLSTIGLLSFTSGESVQLTHSNWEEHINSKEIALVWHYIENDKNCDSLKEPWRKLGNRKFENVFVGQIDCANSQGLCKEKGVMMLPMVFSYINGERLDFVKVRDHLKLLEYVKARGGLMEGETEKQYSEPPDEYYNYYPVRTKEEEAEIIQAALKKQEDDKAKQMKGLEDKEPNVVILDDVNFNVEIGDKAMALVMYGSPDCMGCKMMKEDWDIVSVRMPPQILIGKVVCEDMDGLCEGITTYPYIRVYRKGQLYGDLEHRKAENIIEYIKTGLQEMHAEEEEAKKEKSREERRKRAEEAAANRPEPVERPPRPAKLLNGENFKAEIKAHDYTVVQFIPAGDDCGMDGNCEAKILGFNSISTMLQEMMCARIYCKNDPEICTKYDITEKSNPSYRAFYDNKKGKVYVDNDEETTKKYWVGHMNAANKRQKEGAAKPKPDLKAEPVKEKTAEPVKEEPVKEEPVKTEKFEPAVVSLTTENFWAFLNSKDYTVVKFFAPWCGHCKKMAPTWEAVAKIENTPDSRVLVAEVDCTQQQTLCKNEGVSGYPTLRAYKNGEFDTEVKDRSEEGIRALIKKGLKKTSQSQDTSKDDKKDNKDSGPKIESKDTAGTKKASESQGVISLTPETYDAVINSPETKLVLVKFFAPWCGHCKSMASAWEAVAKTEHKANNGVIIAEVNCDNKKNIPICKKNEVTGYPTLRAYKDGEFHSKVPERSESGIRKFIDKVSDRVETPKSVDPRTVKQDVVALDDNNIDTAFTNYDFIVVKFYAPWCGHCKKMAPAWKQIAKEFNNVMPATGVLVAEVDCTEEKALCARYDVTGYPTLKTFGKGGKYIGKLNDRSEKGIRKYIQNRPTLKGHDEL